MTGPISTCYPPLRSGWESLYQDVCRTTLPPSDSNVLRPDPWKPGSSSRKRCGKLWISLPIGSCCSPFLPPQTQGDVRNLRIAYPVSCATSTWGADCDCRATQRGWQLARSIQRQTDAHTPWYVGPRSRSGADPCGLTHAAMPLRST